MNDIDRSPRSFPDDHGPEPRRAPSAAAVPPLIDRLAAVVSAGLVLASPRTALATAQVFGLRTGQLAPAPMVACGSGAGPTRRRRRTA